MSSRYPEVKAPAHLVYGANDWGPAIGSGCQHGTAAGCRVQGVGHFIALERPEIAGDLLVSVT